jgi:hypothetical protein
MGKFGIALGILVIVLGVVYLWPVQQKDFAALAGKVDAQTRQVCEHVHST